MTEWEFHPTLVAPFYGQLMGAHIVSDTMIGEDERRRLLAEFRTRAAEVTDAQLREMLAAGWRSSLVAAWYIACLGKTEFRAEIEGMLLKRPNHIHHLCICLSRFGGEGAVAALLGYLRECAAGTLQHDPLDESITPEWALCAVEYLGAPEDVECARRYWEQFLENVRRYRNGNPWGRKLAASILEMWGLRLQEARMAHARVMKLFEEALTPEGLR